MFKCAITGKISKPNEPMIKVVTETRPKVYENMVYDEDEEGGRVILSKGFETVKEIAVTQEGLDIMKATVQ